MAENGRGQRRQGMVQSPRALPPSDQYLHHVRQVLDSGCSNRVWRETRAQANASKCYKIVLLNPGTFLR